MEEIEIHVENDEKRIDKFLSFFFKEKYDFSRTYIQKLIENNNVFVNNNLVNCHYLLKKNDVIKVKITENESISSLPEEIDFKIIYQDDDLLVIDKPNNLTVHPCASKKTGTLVNGLLYKIQTLSSIGGNFRPGIVHRLDKMTTGLMIIAKNNKSHKILSEMLSNNQIYKEYIALVHNIVEPNAGKIEAPIGRDKKDRKKMAVTEFNSKNAITHFKVLQRYKNASKISCVLQTGRTHQIRVHMSYINHPVIGDPLYAYKEDKKEEFGQYLHSYKLEFNHPINNKKISLICDLPKEFNDKIKILEK